MGITYGFYNSVNHDRVYNANQMSQIFDGIVNDGVYYSGNQAIEGRFAVTPAGGFVVNVGSGRAWFNHTWTFNDGNVPLTIEQPDLAYPRKDLIVIDVNYADNVRANSIVVVTGIPAPNPVDPTLINTAGHAQYPIARISVPQYSAEVTEITAAMITSLVGTSACPWVTGLLRTTSIDYLYTQWQAQFEEWFEHLQDELDDHQAAHLQHEIDSLNAYKDGKSSWSEITLAASSWNGTAKTYSLESLYSSEVYDIINVLPTTNTTDAQRTAWTKADCGGYNAAGNVIIAKGDVPAIDIVIGVCVRKKAPIVDFNETNIYVDSNGIVNFGIM